MQTPVENSERLRQPVDRFGHSRARFGPNFGHCGCVFAVQSTAAIARRRPSLHQYTFRVRSDGCDVEIDEIVAFCFHFAVVFSIKMVKIFKMADKIGFFFKFHTIPLDF
jgi:hypothetical protein